MGKLGFVYFSFSGRISRMTFWLSLLGLCVVEGIVFAVLVPMLLGDVTAIDPNDTEAMMALIMRVNIPVIIISLVFFWPALAVYAKRWHDRGKSAWWTLIGLIPLIGAIWALVELGFLRGTAGPNRYGDDPLGGYATAAA